MNNNHLNKYEDVARSQKELNKRLNQLEAEAKITLFILQSINEKGVLNK